MPTSILKDPADEWDVKANHAAQMAKDADTITSSAWRIPGSLDENDEPVPGWLQIDDAHDDTHTTTSATVWVKGGTAGEKYDVINTVETAGGRTWEKTIRVLVFDQ